MIYLLEDDASIRDFVVYTLSSQGMEARGFERPSEFWAAVAEAVPALVLLAGHPQITGIEGIGCEKLRRMREHLPGSKIKYSIPKR